MALSKRDRRTLTLGGIALGLIGVYLLLIEPALSGYDQRLTRHARLAGRVTRIMEQNQAAAYYEQEITRWEEEVSDLGPPQPYSLAIAAVREKILAAAKSNGVKLKGTSPTSRSPWGADPTLEQVKIRLEGETSWEKVFAFIAALHRIQSVLSIETLGLKSDPKKGGKINLTLTLSILTRSEIEDQVRWAS